MRYLTLVRHAKSDWGDPEVSDHDRPLNGRGNRVAPEMGKYLAERVFDSGNSGVPRPGCMVSSTALRAKTTAEIYSSAIGFGEALILEPELYEASEEDILGVVRNLPEEIEHAVLFGHNPGMEYCTGHLLGYGSSAQKMGPLVTCGTVILRIREEFWALVDSGSAELVDYIFPKGLGIH